MTDSGASVCEILGEHLTAIPVVDERLELLGYLCGACGARADCDGLFGPPGPTGVATPTCRACGAEIRYGGFSVPLPSLEPLVFPLVDACSPACVAALLAPQGPPSGDVVVPTGEALEAWRRWLADPANHYQGPPIPLDEAE